MVGLVVARKFRNCALKVGKALGRILLRQQFNALAKIPLGLGWNAEFPHGNRAV
jgi:hypothetical protein